MVAELAEKGQEMKAMKADFFNQQEALVRETNLLKNKLHSTTTNPSVVPTMHVNETSAEHFLARPPPPPHLFSASRGGLGLGAGGGRGGSGIELQEQLHKEALQQDLHEQVIRMGE